MSSAGNLVIIDDSGVEPLDGNTHNAFQSEAEQKVSAGRGRPKRKSRSKGRGRGGNGSRPASVGPTLRGHEIGNAQRQSTGMSSTSDALCMDLQQVNIVRDERSNVFQIRQSQTRLGACAGGGYQASGVGQPVHTLQAVNTRQGHMFARQTPILGNLNQGIAGRMNNDSDVIFNFMVKNMAGKGTPQEIARQSGMFPLDVDIDNWFRQRKDKFVLIEKNNIIHTVLAYNKAVAFCFNYTTPDSCKLANCPKYHVCRHLLAGKCDYGQMNCKFSHYFFDQHNIRVSGNLGFLSNKFTSEEICTILKTSQPHVCLNWALKTTCANESCIDLHICPRYILGKCNNGRECFQCHDQLSEHNKPIVNAFGMSEMPYGLFRFRVFLKKLPDWSRNESATSVLHPADAVKTTEAKESTTSVLRPADAVMTTEAKAVPGKVVNRNFEPTDSAISYKADAIVCKQATKITSDKQSSAKRGQTQLETDGAGSKNICDLHIIGKCSRKRNKACDNLHGDGALPYLWQIQWFGCWKTLKTHESEAVEKAFCDNLSLSDIFSKIFDDMQINIYIVFQPYIQARISITGVDEGFSKTQARRLSTASYKEQPEGGQDGLRTQWRWYWENDDKNWQLFQPDTLQHTLEAKYLAKQATYIYWRENYQFKYVINFDKMYQQNMGTRKKRNITRRPVFVSSEDVKGKQQLLQLTQAPVVDVILPPDWLPWDLTHPFEMVDITGLQSETEKVTCHFYKTLDKTKFVIRSIVRIQNPKLWGLFCSQEKTMEANARRLGQDQDIEKRYLFHGTDNMGAVIGICINNFDMRLSGKNATRFGDGAYFARDAKYSHAYTQEPIRYIFMANVLVGQSTKGDASYRRPPPKPGSDHELYDSCVDNLTNPSVFVVFDKNQYYPEYLIQYQDSPEQPNEDLINNQYQQQSLTKPQVPKILQVPYVQPPVGNVLTQPTQSTINRQSVESTQNVLAVQNDRTCQPSTQQFSQPLVSRTLDPTTDGYRTPDSYTYSVSTDVDTGHTVSSVASIDTRRLSAVVDFAALKTKTNIDAETRIRRPNSKLDAFPSPDNLQTKTNTDAETRKRRLNSKLDAFPSPDYSQTKTNIDAETRIRRPNSKLDAFPSPDDSKSIVDLSSYDFLEKLKLKNLKLKMFEKRNGDPVSHHHSNPVSQGDSVPQHHCDTVYQRHGDTVPEHHRDSVPQHRSDTVYQRYGDTVPEHHRDSVPQHHSDTVYQRHGNTVPEHDRDSVPQHHCDTVFQRHGDTVPEHHRDTVYQHRGYPLFHSPGEQESHPSTELDEIFERFRRKREIARSKHL